MVNKQRMMIISTDNKANAAQNFFTLADNLLNMFSLLQMVCNYYADELCAKLV